MKGCTEFASDIEMDNMESYHFHIKLGFREENRLIAFAKIFNFIFLCFFFIRKINLDMSYFL